MTYVGHRFVGGKTMLKRAHFETRQPSAHLDLLLSVCRHTKKVFFSSSSSSSPVLKVDDVKPTLLTFGICARHVLFFFILVPKSAKWGWRESCRIIMARRDCVTTMCPRPFLPFILSGVPIACWRNKKPGRL